MVSKCPRSDLDDRYTYRCDDCQCHRQYEPGRPLSEYPVEPDSHTGKIASDGGPSEYYDFPEGCNTLNDLIEHKEMSFAHGNIFKAAFRLGHKQGISLEYDLNKIKYYADRMLARLRKGG